MKISFFFFQFDDNFFLIVYCRYQYFSLDINGLNKGRIFVNISERKSTGSTASSSPDRDTTVLSTSIGHALIQDELLSEIDIRFGRGVYSTDSLANLVFLIISV